MSECIHDLDPETCALCLGHVRVDHNRPILDLLTDKPEVTVEAKFDGLCMRCEGNIEAGTSISLWNGQWIHTHHFDLRDW